MFGRVENAGSKLPKTKGAVGRWLQMPLYSARSMGRLRWHKTEGQYWRQPNDQSSGQGRLRSRALARIAPNPEGYQSVDRDTTDN